jgi:alginate O-acetyltransferase complex protein AlgI
MLAAHRWWRHRPGAVPSQAFFARAFSWGLTFVAVNLAWAFFCMDIRTALCFLRRLFVG